MTNGKQDEREQERELTPDELAKVTGGDKTVVLQHEKVTGGSTPTESVTFTYGGMQIDYGKQNP